MADQAEKLRNLVQKKKAKTIAIIGAKGGVGRSTLVANLSLALREEEQDVCMVDLDFRMSNLSVLLNERPRWNLGHLLEKEVSLSEVLHQGREEIFLLGGSHGRNFTDLTVSSIQEMLELISPVKEEFDFVIVDTPRELSKESECIWKWADHLILLTTPEPTSLVGTYALLRRVSMNHPSVGLVINRAQNKRQEREVVDLICRAGEEFMDLSILTYGGIPEDYRVFEALCRRQPYVLEYPKSSASRATQGLAHKILNHQREELNKGIFSVFKRIV